MQTKPQYQLRDYLYQEWVINKKSQSKIALENNVSTITIERWIKQNNLCFIRPKSKLVYEGELFNLDNPCYCHLLGFIAADGCVKEKDYRVEISLSEIDSNLLEFYIDYFKLPIKVYHYNYSYSKPKCTINIVSKTLVEHLTILGINTPQKTFNLKFPEGMKDEFYKYFIRGFLDGDAHINRKGFRVTGASFNFIKDLTDFLNKKFGYSYKVTYQKGKNRSYPKIEMCGYKARVALKWIYSENEHFGLQRKMITVKNILSI